MIRVRIIDDSLEARLHEIALDRSPNEAVGIILSNGIVIEIDNLSETPDKSFKVSRDQITKALFNESDASAVTFWHSHPNGGVGPSRIDLQQRTPFNHHLVVTLSGDTLVSSWY